MKIKPKNEYVKIYIPLDSRHIYAGANKIFDFLSQNNIKHQSKIAKRIRFDDIVVRLHKAEDIEKLTNFVNNDPYIKEGLIEANPFAYQKDGLAITSDGKLSYNQTVTKFICLYIDFKKNNNQLEQVGLPDFLNYLNNYYYNVFVSNNLDAFLKDFNDIKFFEASNYFINYKQVLALIIKQFSPDFSFNDYLTHFNACNALNKNLDYLNLNTLQNNNGRQNGTQNSNGSEYIENNLNALLLEAINIMENKYGRLSTIKMLQKYLETKEANYITRDSNLRSRLVSNNFANNLRDVLKQRNLKLEQYVELLENKQHITEDKEQILVASLINNYHQAESKNYSGLASCINALQLYIFKNELNGFTRANGIRDTIKMNFTPKEILEILNCHYGYSEFNQETIYNMCYDYVNEFIDKHKQY